MSFKKYLKESEHSASEFVYGLKALGHLQEALDYLQEADDNKAGHYEDWKHYISLVQEIISTDHGEAGLEPFLKNIKPE